MFLCQSLGDSFSPFNNPSLTGTRGIFSGSIVSWIVSMPRRLPFIPQDKLLIGIMFFTGLNQEHLGKLGKRHRRLTRFPLHIKTMCRLTVFPTPRFSVPLLCASRDTTILGIIGTRTNSVNDMFRIFPAASCRGGSLCISLYRFVSLGVSL